MYLLYPELPKAEGNTKFRNKILRRRQQRQTICAQAMNQVQMSCTCVFCLCMKALLPVGGWVSYYRIYIRNLFLENVI